MTTSTLTLLPLLRQPEAQVALYLADPPGIKAQLRHPVLGWMALRSVAILGRSLAMHAVLPGIILALGSLLLQGGVWAGLVWALPTLLHPYRITLNHRQAAVLATLLCGPVWIGGIVFVLPEEPLVLLLLSRLVLLVCGLYGARLFERAMHVVPCAEPARLPAVASAAGTYAAVYLALFVAVGILTNVVLYLAER